MRLICGVILVSLWGGVLIGAIINEKKNIDSSVSFKESCLELGVGKINGDLYSCKKLKRPEFR